MSSVSLVRLKGEGGASTEGKRSGGEEEEEIGGMQREQRSKKKEFIKEWRNEAETALDENIQDSDEARHG